MADTSADGSLQNQGNQNGPVVNGPNDVVIVKAVINRSTDSGWMGRKVGKRLPTAIGEIVSVQTEDGKPGTLYVHDLTEAAKLVFPNMEEDFYLNMTAAQKLSVISEVDVVPTAFDSRYFGTTVPNFRNVTEKVCKGFGLTADVDRDDLSMVKCLNELYRKSGAGVAVITFRVGATVNTMTTLTVNGAPRDSVLLDSISLVSVEPVKTGTSSGIATSGDAAKQSAAGLASWRKNLASQASSSRRKGAVNTPAVNTAGVAQATPELEAEEEVLDESYI